MPTFYLKSRKTMPFEYTTVNAISREEAIAQVIHSAGEGESIEVLDSEDITSSVGPSGTTGTTGTTGGTGPTGRMR